MASFNRVILMGHLTRDPQLRTLPNSDNQVCDFALAVNRRWGDANGNDRDEVLFIDCAAFGRTGQTIGENLTKGRPIHVEGRLRFEQWEQDDGQPPCVAPRSAWWSSSSGSSMPSRSAAPPPNAVGSAAPPAGAGVRHRSPTPSRSAQVPTFPSEHGSAIPIRPRPSGTRRTGDPS